MSGRGGRLIARGAGALTERELIALLVRNGTRGASALDLAADLLAEFGGLRALASARPEELATRTGIGDAKATALVAAFELGRRTVDDGAAPVRLRRPEDVARVASGALAGLRRERVVVLVADGANRLRRTVTVAEGSIDRAPLAVREVLNAVLRHDGRAFAVARNHPSGDVEPGEADRRATADLRAAAGVV